MTDLVIANDTRVTLHFSLTLEDGSVVDSNFDKQPASFDVGDGSLLAGFEKKIHGMKAGQKASFTVLPEESFGQPNPANIQRFSRSDFAQDMELTEGLVISFADAGQSELPGVVTSITDEAVMVDFNHPLAGRTIQFDVGIVAVENASVEKPSIG